MFKFKKTRAIFTACIVLVLFSSCFIENEIFIRKDGSGYVNFHYQLEPFVITVMQDMMEFSNTDQPSGPFQMDKIRAEFEKKDYLTLKELESPSPEALRGSFTFTDLEEVFSDNQELEEKGVLQLEKAGNTTKVKVYITRSNVNQLSAISGMEENPLFDMFGPKENEEITKDEYLEMMAFAFGDEAPPALRESFIRLRVKVEGQIVSHQGGSPIENGVVFKIPLLDVLLLQEPIEYSIDFE